MKNERQIAILEIIKQHDIDTQEELISLLRKKGYDITQATVSRDIREMKIVKVLSEKGKYKYVLRKEEKKDTGVAYANAISASVTSIEYSNNLAVVKTYPGMAQGVAIAIDNLNISGFMGCVAGDDTIFVAFHTLEQTQRAVNEVKKLLDN